MMENSSNADMNQLFEHLANIKQVEPGVHLYAQTLKRLKKQNVVPLFWARAAACILIIVIAAESYIALNHRQATHQDISSVIYQPSNFLYDE